MKFCVDMAGVTILSLLWVVYLTVFCVMGIQTYDLIFKGNSSMKSQNVSVTFGSDVTFVCPNRVTNRTTWYKSPITQYAAYIDYAGGKCILTNGYHPSISLGRHCTGGNYSITIDSVRYNDSGLWRCSINSTGIQGIDVHVFPQQGTTHSTTAKPTTLTSTAPNPSTTTTLRITSQRPDRTIITVTESETSTFHNSTTPGIISGTQVNIGNSTTDELQPPIGYLIPVIVGVCGVVVLVVVVIVVLKLRPKKDKQDVDQGYRNPEDTNQAQISAPGGDYSNLHGDPQIDSHVYTDITEGTRGQVVRTEGNYSTLHTDSHEYTHMYGVIDGRAQERFQAQLTPQQVDYYNCGPQKKEDVHLYTNVDDGGYETCQTTL